MAIFKRKDKRQVTQLGKPIIKSTEVNQVSDVSKVQVVDTSQKASDIVKTGDIQKVIQKTTSGGGKSTLVTPTQPAQVNQKETYVEETKQPEIVKQQETKREIRKEIKQQVNLEKQRYKDLGYKTSQARKLAKESIKQSGVTYTTKKEKQEIRDTKKDSEFLNKLVGVDIQKPVYGTIIEENKKELPIEIYPEGTIYIYYTGEVSKITGLPIREIRVVEKDGERLATREEINLIDPLVLKKGEGKETRTGRFIGEKLGSIKKFTKEEFEPAVYFENKLEKYGEKGKVSKVISEVAKGIIPTSKGEVIGTVATFGIGYGLGVATKGVGQVISRLPQAKYLTPAYQGLTTGTGLLFTRKYTKGIYQDVKKTGSYESVGKGVREFAIIGKGFGKGSKFVEKWTTPYTNVIELEPLEPFAFEKVYTKEIEGEPIRVSEYLQFIERKPQTLEVKTTKLREKYPTVFGPLKISSTPREFIELKTIEPTKLDTKETFGVAELVKGRKYKTLYGLKGTSKKIETIDNVDLNVGLLESTKALRISKPSKKDISIRTPLVSGFKGFKPNLQFTETKTISSTLELPSGLKITRSFTKFEGEKNKLRTTIFEKQGEQNKIYDILYHGTTEKQLPRILEEGLKPSKLTGETKGLDTKELVSLGKTPEDVSGFATRSALRNRLKGIEDKPVILEVQVPKGQAKENVLISGIKEFNVLEVPKENIKLLQTKETQLPKLNLKVTKPKQKQQIIKEEFDLPSMVGGKGLKTVPYSSEGIYETQELSAVSLPSVSSKSIIDIKQTQTELTKPKVSFGSKAKNILKDLIRPKEENRFIESSKSVLGEVQAPRQQFRQLTKQDQALKLINLLKTSQASKSKIKNIPIRTPKLKFKLDLPKIESKITRDNKLDSFEVFVKKKGKEEFIDDSFKTLGEAKSRLSKELISTLRASGGILKGGKKLEFEDIGLNEFEFRPSKSNKFLVVEKKEKRLRKGGTGKQIQVFR